MASPRLVGGLIASGATALVLDAPPRRGAVEVQFGGNLLHAGNVVFVSLLQVEHRRDRFLDSPAHHDLSGGGYDVGHQRAHRRVVLDGGDDIAVLVATTVLAVYQRMRLDGAQQLTDVAPQAHRLRWDDLANVVAKGMITSQSPTINQR